LATANLPKNPSAVILAAWEKSGVAPVTKAVDAPAGIEKLAVAMVAPSLRPKHAAALLGVAVSTLWRWAADRPGFPQPIRLSARCTVWPRDALIKWRDAQAAREVS